MLPTRLNHDLDNLCELDLSVIDTAQTPPKSFKYYTEQGAAWKSPLTGDILTQAEAWLFDNPAHVSTPDPSVKRANCYICRDPDFAKMGLPLCTACRFCGGHVAADDSGCDDCGKEQLPDCTGCGRDHPDCTCGAPGVCHCDYCKAGTDLSHRKTESKQQ